MLHILLRGLNTSTITGTALARKYSTRWCYRSMLPISGRSSVTSGNVYTKLIQAKYMVLGFYYTYSNFRIWVLRHYYLTDSAMLLPALHCNKPKAGCPVLLKTIVQNSTKLISGLYFKELSTYFSWLMKNKLKLLFTFVKITLLPTL